MNNRQRRVARLQAKEDAKLLEWAWLEACLTANETEKAFDNSLNVRNKFSIASKTEDVYTAIIVNVNEFRESNMKYLIDIYRNGKYQGDWFVGDSFFRDSAVTPIEVKL